MPKMYWFALKDCGFYQCLSPLHCSPVCRFHILDQSFSWTLKTVTLNIEIKLADDHDNLLYVYMLSLSKKALSFHINLLMYLSFEFHKQLKLDHPKLQSPSTGLVTEVTWWSPRFLLCWDQDHVFCVRHNYPLVVRFSPAVASHQIIVSQALTEMRFSAAWPTGIYRLSSSILQSWRRSWRQAGSGTAGWAPALQTFTQRWFSPGLSPFFCDLVVQTKCLSARDQL